MKISAIIVNFRTYEELGRCLSSVAGQSRPPDQVVVVDQDGVADAFRDVARRFPAVAFIEATENKGFAYGVNLAARTATGDGLLLVNPDCVLAPATVAELADWLDGRPDVGVVGPRVEDLDGTQQASARRFPNWTTGLAGRRSALSRLFPGNRLSERNLLTPQVGSQPVQVDWVSGACMLVRRAAFDAVGGFDPGFFLYWEDADFCRRLLEAGWPTWHHPGPTVTHAVGRSSRKAPLRSMLAFHRSAWRYYWKHGSSLDRALSPLAAAALATRCATLLAALAARRAARPGRAAAD